MSDKLKDKLTLAEIKLRVAPTKGLHPAALDDVAARLSKHFDVDDDGNLRVKPNTATVSWATPESMVEELRGSAGHFFTDTRSSGHSGPSKSEIESMSPEEKLAFANEMTKPAGVK